MILCYKYSYRNDKYDIVEVEERSISTEEMHEIMQNIIDGKLDNLTAISFYVK